MKNTLFGKEVRKKLIDLDMTTSELAKILGISVSYLNEILKGTRKGKRHKKSISQILDLGDKAIS